MLFIKEWINNQFIPYILLSCLFNFSWVQWFGTHFILNFLPIFSSMKKYTWQNKSEVTENKLKASIPTPLLQKYLHTSKIPFFSPGNNVINNLIFKHRHSAYNPAEDPYFSKNNHKSNNDLNPWRIINSRNIPVKSNYRYVQPV